MTKSHLSARYVLPATLIFGGLLLTNAHPALAQRVGTNPQMTVGAPQQLPRVNDAPQDEMSERIVAKVNDDVITTADVKARLALAFLTSNLPQTPENQQRLLPQVLHSLIDEQLELQEAKRDNITPDPAEEQKFIDKIGNDNGVPPGHMGEFLAAHGIPLWTLQTQVHAYLAWAKVVQTKLRPQIEVGAEEIQSQIDRLKANEGKPEYLLAEIYLPVDSSGDESQVAALASRLSTETRSNGHFAGAAQQFSQGLGAQQGGDLGWIEKGQLAPELEQTVEAMKKGEVSDPIKTGDGYHILYLRDERKMSLSNPEDATFKLAAFVLPLATLPSPQDGQDAPQTMMRVNPRQDNLGGLKPAQTNETSDRITKAKELGEKLRSHLTDCSKADDAVHASGADWQVEIKDNMRLGDQAPMLQAALANLQPNGSTEPLLSDKNAAVFLVCERHEASDSFAKEHVADALGGAKLDMQAKALLRDLRRTAFIDINED